MFKENAMKASDFLVNELKLKLNEEQIQVIDERMKLKGAKKIPMKFLLNDKSKIDKIKTTQAKILAKSLENQKEPVDMNQWADLAIKAGLTTKQEPSRIVAYYKRRLIDEGVVKEVA